MLLEEKNQCNCVNAERHEANLLGLQCNSDSNLEKNNLLSTFEYQVLSVKTLSLFVAVTAQNSQKKCDCDCLSNSILNRNARIMKEKVQKECKLSTLKTLHSDE